MVQAHKPRVLGLCSIFTFYCDSSHSICVIIEKLAKAVQLKRRQEWKTHQGYVAAILEEDGVQPPYLKF